MTVYCERDTQKTGNVCIKCNGTWAAGTPLPACSAMGASVPMRQACFPKAGGPFDMQTNPPSDKKYEICVRCGNSWPHNSIPPDCPRDGAMVGFIPAKDQSFRDGAIVGTNIVETPKNPIQAILGLQPDEPFFVLRASDLLADYLVEEWARKAEQHGCDPKRVRAAREKAQEFRAWAGERRYPA